MKIKTVYLRPEDEAITLTAYISDSVSSMEGRPRPAILVIPGGGYSNLADREGEPIAKVFLAEGFQAFVLLYSVGEKALFPRPLVDASRAIVHIREHAEEYGVDPERVFVVGFSAGGHLAASTATLWHEEYAKAYPDMPEGLNRPTGAILSYPVITSGPYAHRGSFNRILGTTTPTEEQSLAYSLEHHVDEKTVPVYIWHTAEDKAVPVQNTLLFAAALAKNKVPFEMRIFPYGPHGLSRSDEETNRAGHVGYPEVRQWLSEAIAWTGKI